MHKTICILYLTLSMSILGGGSQLTYGQKAGPQVVSFHSTVDDTEQPYGLYLPPKYTPKKKYPLVVMLHGAGSNHRLSLRRVFGESNRPGENDVEASLYFPEWKDVDMIVISPYARGTMGYQGIAEKDVWDAVADVKKRFSIDEDRTYLTGLSMGGGGTLWIGLTRSDFWAAIAPVCPAPPPGTDIYFSNAANVPVHLFQGDADPVVRVEGTRKIVETIRQTGTTLVYDEYPNVQHDSWVNAYQNGAIFDWFKPFKRNRFPEKVVLTTNQLRYNKAFWVEATHFTVGDTAQVIARFIAKNQLEIEAKKVNAFTLHLEGHPQVSLSKSIRVQLNGQTIDAVPTSSGHVYFSLNAEGNWVNEVKQQIEENKKPFLEGPMTDAFSDRHIYVYGTADNPTPSELERRRKEALEAAEWSFHRGDFLGRVMVFPRLMADREIRPNDIERSNLILFGTSQTNQLINQLAANHPLQLKENQVQNYSLTYIYPNKNRYVLINSGIAWWKSAGQDPNGLLARLSVPGPAGKLRGKGDFLLFEKDNATHIWSGSFNENWQIGAKEKEQLNQSNALILK